MIWWHCGGNAKRQEGVNDPDEDGFFDVADNASIEIANAAAAAEERSERLHDIVFSCIHRHDNPPAASGHCATSIAHKAAALCHMWALEVQVAMLKWF